MTESPNTVLLIADISGYTRFVKQHAISVSHAKQIIVRLLKALIHSARPPLVLAELEGDAVFFYARTNGKNFEKVAQEVKSQVVKFFSAFESELAAINSVKTCSCDACDHAHNLQLKQVVHAGNVELAKIAQFEKLFGLDVIVVHRMLKNSVPSNEYVMMTDSMYKSVGDFFGLQPERFMESFEGVGEVETLVFYPKHLPQQVRMRESQSPSLLPFKKLLWRIEISIKTLLDVIGLHSYKGTFDSLSS